MSPAEQAVDPIEIGAAWQPPTIDATSRVRVLLVDGDPIARGVLHDELRRHGELVLVAEATDGVEACELALHYRPQVVVLDADVGRIGALEVTHRLACDAPEVRVLLLARYVSDDLALVALRAGASGFRSKQRLAEGLLDDVRAVARHEAVITTEVAGELLRRLRGLPRLGSGVRPVRSRLTAREWEVLDLLGRGSTTAQAARILGLSPATIDSHRKSVMRKLGARSTADALVAADGLWAAEAAV